MSEMVERVAEAICRAEGRHAHQDGYAALDEYVRASYSRQARAAIEAMREPTLAMTEAARRAEDQHSEWTAPAITYQAMVDAALSEP